MRYLHILRPKYLYEILVNHLIIYILVKHSLTIEVTKCGLSEVNYFENFLNLKIFFRNLLCNLIRKIEYVNHFSKLTKLDFSYNKITRIQNIENLIEIDL